MSEGTDMYILPNLSSQVENGQTSVTVSVKTKDSEYFLQSNSPSYDYGQSYVSSLSNSPTQDYEQTFSHCSSPHQGYDQSLSHVSFHSHSPTQDYDQTFSHVRFGSSSPSEDYDKPYSGSNLTEFSSNIKTLMHYNNKNEKQDTCSPFNNEYGKNLLNRCHVTPDKVDECKKSFTAYTDKETDISSSWQPYNLNNDDESISWQPCDGELEQLKDAKKIVEPTFCTERLDLTDKVFACYLCNEVLSWTKVSPRNMRPFHEGQTYMCNKCDKKDDSLTNKPQIESEVLNAAIVESVSSKGFDYLTGSSGKRDTNVQHSSARTESKMEGMEKDDGDDYVKRRYTCSICNKKFKRNGHLQRHERTHSVDRQKFQCDTCPKCYSDFNSLVRHKKCHLGDNSYDEKPYTCGICEKKFRDNYDLQRHLRIHTGEQPFKCTMCVQAFIDKRTLEKHIKRHLGEKLFICSICNKGFIDNRSLKRHTRTYKGLTHYKCDICDKTFHNTSQLSVHLKTHDDVHKHTCKFCKESFRSVENLKLHTIIHEDLAILTKGIVQ